jgi:hypothetical protein
LLVFFAFFPRGSGVLVKFRFAWYSRSERDLGFDFFELVGITLLYTHIVTAGQWKEFYRREREALGEAGPNLERTVFRGWSSMRGLKNHVWMRSLAFTAALIFVLALNNFAVPAILQTKVLPDELWVQFNTTFFERPDGGFDLVRMLRLSLPLIIAPVLLLAMFSRRGVAWGQTVANAILVWRSTDGFTPAPPPYFGRLETGFWRPTPPMNLPGRVPQFATMTPWGILSPDQFRSAGPLALVVIATLAPGPVACAANAGAVSTRGPGPGGGAARPHGSGGRTQGAARLL